jgi:hypothetical protein
MDVDIPQGRIDTLKQFLAHIGTITLGVLIALFLEGAADWRKDRQLVRDAKANLDSEILDNKAELEDLLAKVPGTRKQVERTLQIVQKLLKNPGNEIDETFRLSFDAATLSTTSQNTAQATGALAHMEYREVKRYARVYDLQADFTRIQDRLLDEVIMLLSAAQGGALNAPPSTLRPELESMKQGTLRTLSHLNATETFAKELVRGYTDALAGK